MAWIIPEVAVQRLLQYGVAQLRKDKCAFDEIFAYQRSHPLMARGYGPAYVDRIWQWFNTEKIRVVHAWILSPETVPCYSIHLASDSENENFAAISDFYGDEDDSDTGVASFNVMIDIGVHGNKAADEVLWLYYILSYILFKYKPVAQDLGITIQTYSASDWQKEASKMPENIWTRWVRMKCSVWHTWKASDFEGPYDLETELSVERVGDDDEQKI